MSTDSSRLRGKAVGDRSAHHGLPGSRYFHHALGDSDLGRNGLGRFGCRCGYFAVLGVGFFERERRWGVHQERRVMVPECQRTDDRLRPYQAREQHLMNGKEAVEDLVEAVR
jgi:hypothetical protein